MDGFVQRFNGPLQTSTSQWTRLLTCPSPVRLVIRLIVSLLRKLYPFDKFGNKQKREKRIPDDFLDQFRPPTKDASTGEYRSFPAITHGGTYPELRSKRLCALLY